MTIIDFKDDLQPARGKKLVADLRKKLAASYKIPLIEHDALATALRESHIENPAFLEVDAARKLGKRLNANLVLTGRIVDFNLEEKVINVPLLWSTTKYIATFKTEILLVRTFRGRQSFREVTGTGEVKKRNIQLLYLGQDNNFQFISAAEKQRAVKAAYDDLINNLVKVITS